MKYKTRITRLTVLPEGEPIFSEKATNIEIEDEAAGEYVKVTQDGNDSPARAIFIDPADWPEIKAAIEQLLADCQS